MMDNTSFRSPGDLIDGGSRRGRESVIDQDCFFEGTFRTPGNMRIEGTYQGVIECQGTLLIAESGQVNARIVAGNLIVGGQLSGEVQCQSRFELLKSGRTSGAVAAQATVIHDGAYFDGEIRMGARDSVPVQASPTTSAPQSPPIVPSPADASTARPAAPSSGGRRRAGMEGTGEGEGAAAADLPTPDEPGESQSSRTNGRSQPAPARDIVPNRTAEP